MSTATADELALLRDLARSFFEREAVPNHERWHAQHHVDREFWLKAGELGLLCASVPEEYGGGGGTFAHDAVLAFEQGRTLDQTYLYHSEHWRSASSYVALTRHRNDVSLFVATETARDLGQLARQMARVDDSRAASQFYADDGPAPVRPSHPSERLEQLRIALGAFVQRG